MPHPSLENAAWLNTPAIKKLFAALLLEGDEVRAVGGAPRNHLLGAPVSDVDLAAQLPPQEIIARAEKAGIKHIPTGIDHGTITLVIDGHAYEVTSLRRDVETDGRHAIVRFGTDWLEDARRRDFTINALYVSADGTLHDPLGTGIEDIKNRRLRFIGDAETRIREDHLRSLRFYRFAAWYAAPPYDPEAITATIRQRAGLRALSAERVNAELFKLLGAPDPRAALHALYQAGLLTDIVGTAPNIALAQNLIASEQAMSKQPDPLLRLAALAIWHEGDAARLAQALRLSNKQQAALAKLSRYPLFPSPDDKAAVTEFRYRAGQEHFSQLAMLAMADRARANGPERWINMIKESEENPLPPFPLSGADLIEAGHQPGPQLGELLSRLEARWLASGMTLTRDDLLRLG